MNIYKLKISYRGTSYSGWQIQSQGEKTIQGELHKALEKICKSSEVKSIGSGRTDAGVHALAQIVKIELPILIPEHGLFRGLNTFLPSDIRILGVEKINSEFCPIRDAKSKEYNYVFLPLTEIHNPFLNDLICFHDFDLDIEKMQRACRLFLGTHDFSNYQCVGTDVATTIREIFSIEIVRKNAASLGLWDLGEVYVLKIVGEGFLKQMVRLIMGALFSIGRGKINESDILNSLKNPSLNKLGPVAPACGLYLKEVHY